MSWKAPWYDEELSKMVKKSEKSAKKGVKKVVEAVRSHFTGKRRPVKREKVVVEGSQPEVRVEVGRKRRAVMRRE